MSAVDDLVAMVIEREGGVKDVGDGKGVTRWGQTPGWLAQFNLPIPQNPADAARNYVAWLKLTGLDGIVTSADSVSDILMDIAVMSSAPKAIKALQASLRVPVDGVLGAQTILALDGADRGRLAKQIVAWDMRYQGSAITLNPQRAEYAKGWADRMAGHVERLP